jgi:signal transduction histidine kinase/CheY-like chemotaxis protein
MSVAQGGNPRNPELHDNLADLQEQSLEAIVFFAGLIGLFWLVWTICPATGGRVPPLEAWIGSGLLILSAYTSYALRKRLLNVAAPLFVWGSLIAIVFAVLTFRSFALIYLLILPVIFASVLLSQGIFFLVAFVAVFLTLAMGTRMGMLLLSGDVILPVTIITMVALAAWLSARNLYTALEWAWHGYEQARHNEQVARERQGELRRALKALDEATHRLERANYMLALARDQAEDARRLKQQFAQTISHELRTPLNLIAGFTELMTESPEYYGAQLSPAYLRDLNIVHRNACHLQNLVNDVLDLARIEAAQMSLLPEETDPVILVREAVDTARSLVESRGLTLRTEIEPGLPRLWLDPTRTRQVLFNLLNNAARFTEEGGITVTVRRRKESRNGDEVIFAVTDTGMGIASEDISHIFEEFRQADGSIRRRHGGAGLGLAISRRFVGLHGGRIWVESQVGQGSTFYFTLPVSRTDALAAPGGRSPEAPTTVSAKGGERPVLLAVTRSASAAALLTRYVHGCRTVIVRDLEQARRAARYLMPQAVAIDQACEEFDQGGLGELARAWGLSRIPFLACPLPGEEPLRQRLAVDGYLVKPVSRQSLWDVLRRLGENVDRVLVVDDDQDFVLLLSRMLEDNPVRRYEVISAYSGQEALTLIRHRQPDLILLDLLLPEIDGFEVIERIRSTPDWQQIPIVVVSGEDEMDDQETLAGTMMVAKAEGLRPGEVVRWVQNVVDTSVTSLAEPPALKGEPVL